jgi:hypothetical protein
MALPTAWHYISSRNAKFKKQTPRRHVHMDHVSARVRGLNQFVKFKPVVVTLERIDAAELKKCC